MSPDDDIDEIRGMDWSAEKAIFAKVLGELQTVLDEKSQTIDHLTRLAEAARTDDEAHRRLIDAITALVSDHGDLAEMLVDWLPLAFGRHKQQCVLEAKKGTVGEVERRKILELDSALEASHPVPAIRQREIARQLDAKERRVRYVLERECKHRPKR